MSGMTNGVAHVSFSGGGVFVPARSRYDRQILMELVADRAHTNGQVQVLVGSQRWMASWCRGPHARICADCGTKVDVACYSATNHDIGYCVTCALGAAAQPRHHGDLMRRWVGSTEHRH